MGAFYKNFLFWVSLILFLGLVYISFYNVYQTDDYVLAFNSRKFGSPIKGLYSLYHHWSGRYFSFLLAGSNTLLYSNSQLLPKIVPPILLSFFLISVALNLHFYFGIRKTELLKKSFVALFFYIISLSSLSENIFWLTGSMVYFLPIVLSLFILFFIGNFYRKKQKFWAIISIVVLFFTMGCNEIASIILLLSLFFFAFFKKDIFSKILFAVSLLGFAILFLAPGNFQRMSGLEDGVKHLYLKYVGVSIANGVFIILKISFIIPAFIFFFKKELNYINQKVEKKTIALLFLIPVVVLVFMGKLLLISERALDNIILFSLIISCVFLNFYSKNFPKYIVAIVTVFYFLPAFKLFPHKHIYFDVNYNLCNISKDIFKNNLQAYDDEMRNRHKILENSKDQEIFLEPIKNKPSALYFEEIGTLNEKNYINSQLEKFYNKKSVALKK